MESLPGTFTVLREYCLVCAGFYAVNLSNLTLNVTCKKCGIRRCQITDCLAYFYVATVPHICVVYSFLSYEPELFPGLIYRMVKPRVVLLIFVSGKVVLTGAKERSEIIEAFENIYPILLRFKKS